MLAKYAPMAPAAPSSRHTPTFFPPSFPPPSTTPPPEEEEEDMPTIGDIKPGFQSTDHNGWYLLDGRNVNTLATTPRNNAVSIGFLSVLPDASDASLMSSVSNLKQVVGSNVVTITQQQLPKVTYSHTHRMFLNAQTSPTNGVSIDSATNAKPYFAHLSGGGADSYVIKGNNNDINNEPTLGLSGTHSMQLNPSPTQSAIDIRGKYLGVNFFIWLGA